MIKNIKNIMASHGNKLQMLRRITDDERQTLQNVLLGMYIDIMSACRALDIGCTLVGGSALGAVRHNGFIPWDDDFDIGMTRDEWEVFKRNFQQLLGDKYILEAPNYENKDSKQLLSKIYYKGTEYVMLEEMNFPYNNCIFIDVFIIDNVSDSFLVRKFDTFVANLMRVASITSQEFRFPNPLQKRVMTSTPSLFIYYYIRQVAGLLFSLIPHKTWCLWFDRFVSRHNVNKTSKYVTVPTGLKRYGGEMLKREVFFPYSKGLFEGNEVNLPNNTHDYLTIIYGNYMKLPPEDRRETHPIVSLKFPY
ncbi:MAG: LicD family protein [Prevotellaceae bacterium]|nr:LicD family protein [Prevotellaceae bacterium]